MRGNGAQPHIHSVSDSLPSGRDVLDLLQQPYQHHLQWPCSHQYKAWGLGHCLHEGEGTWQAVEASCPQQLPTRPGAQQTEDGNGLAGGPRPYLPGFPVFLSMGLPPFSGVSLNMVPHPSPLQSPMSSSQLAEAMETDGAETRRLCPAMDGAHQHD